MIDPSIDPDISHITTEIHRLVYSDRRGKHSVMVQQKGKTIVVEGRYSFEIDESEVTRLTEKQ